MLRPERIRHAAQDEELQGVLGAREGFVRGEELAPAPLQFRPRLGDLGLGRRARLHPGPRLTELFLGQAHRLLAYIDLLARRHERPVGALPQEIGHEQGRRHLAGDGESEDDSGAQVVAAVAEK